MKKKQVSKKSIEVGKCFEYKEYADLFKNGEDYVTHMYRQNRDSVTHICYSKGNNITIQILNKDFLGNKLTTVTQIEESLFQKYMQEVINSIVNATMVNVSFLHE